MPSPFEILLDPISLSVLAMYAGVLIWERIAPARSLPEVKGWGLRCLAAFVTYFYLASYLPLLWDATLAEHRLMDLRGLGLVSGTLVALGVYELGLYAWHRSMHGSSLLFRIFHQMHHSAERLDVPGAFYLSLTDMVGFTFLASLSLVLVVGVSAEVSTAFLLIVSFLAVFQHANVRTPRWLGYLVQRPEAHSVHHARGVHAHNYADLPVLDMLFGSFRNPVDFVDQTGFYDGASARVGEMLLFLDVSEAPEELRGPDAGARTFLTREGARKSVKVA